MVPKWGEAEKVKIELPLKRELDFWGSGHPQNDKKSTFLGSLFGKGPGTPLGGIFGALGVDFGRF